MAHLLIVDDSLPSREALVELLSAEGYECSPAADGESALAILRSLRIDTVLLDITLPRVSGLAVLEEIRRSRSAVELPVIMVTGHSGSREVVDALSRGANDYVTKPLDLPVLLARVRTQIQLRDLSRLKDEFLDIASHDLKNPLTSVLGSAEFLDSSFAVGTPMTPEGRWFIETITRRAQQMTRIITDFLDMQASHDGRLILRKGPVDLRRIAQQVIEDNRAYGQRKGIALALALGEPLPSVAADEARIAQVVENLLGNAIKFGPPGCQVEVATSTGVSHVVLEVRDTGPGLRDADLEQLFVKGARLSNRPTGNESSTGLGLAWCRQLIELHGGRIGARNGEQCGATFWFELPYEREECDGSAATESSGDPRSPSSS